MFYKSINQTFLSFKDNITFNEYFYCYCLVLFAFLWIPQNKSYNTQLIVEYVNLCNNPINVRTTFST